MRRISVLMIVFVLFAVGAIPAAGARPDSRPFKGSLVGSADFIQGTGTSPFACHNYKGGNLRTDSHATGTASHMGRTSMTSQHCTPEGVDISGGEMTLVAANGDEVYVEYLGTAPPSTEVIVVDLDFTILGGTGRFEGAHGGGKMTVYVVFEGFGDFEWPATWVWDGTIGY